MSLWYTEVEKSKSRPYDFNGRPAARRKTGVLNALFSKSNETKRQIRLVQEGEPSEKQRTKPKLSDVLADNARLKRLLDMSEAEEERNQENVQQIAKLILQKAELEQEMRDREKRYEELLVESQDLVRKMREERDAARTTSPVQKGAAPRHSHSYRTQEDLDKIFKSHDDKYFVNSFRDFEAAIAHAVYNIVNCQPERIECCEVHPSMRHYIDKHHLQTQVIFGIRSLRLVVCRAFMMEFLLERLFRRFLFGLDQESDDTYRDACLAMMAVDQGRGSQWACAAAKTIITSNMHYRPRHSANDVVEELQEYLHPFIEIDTSLLKQVVLVGVELARDCRLDPAIFTLELPAYGTPFDPQRMTCNNQDGYTSIAYSPVVTKRGTRYGEYHISRILLQSKVWRQSTFSELQNLSST